MIKLVSQVFQPHEDLVLVDGVKPVSQLVWDENSLSGWCLNLFLREFVVKRVGVLKRLVRQDLLLPLEALSFLGIENLHEVLGGHLDSVTVVVNLIQRLDDTLVVIFHQAPVLH